MKIKKLTETQTVLTNWNVLKSRFTNQELLEIKNKLPQITFPLESIENWNNLNELWMYEELYSGFEQLFQKACQLNELEKNAANTIFGKFKTIEDKREEVYSKIENERNICCKNYMDAISTRIQISTSILLLMEQIETELANELILLRSNTKAVKELFNPDFAIAKNMTVCRIFRYESSPSIC